MNLISEFEYFSQRSCTAKASPNFNNTDENAVTLCCDCHLVYSKQQHLEDEQRKTLAASLVACDVEKIKEMLGDLI